MRNLYCQIENEMRKNVVATIFSCKRWIAMQWTKFRLNHIHLGNVEEHRSRTTIPQYHKFLLEDTAMVK